jgi:hypothetical protein
MVSRYLLAAVLVAALTSPALAGNCPNLMKKFDAAYAASAAADDVKAEAMKLRKLGEEQHSSGAHEESVATLTKANELLGM